MSQVYTYFFIVLSTILIPTLLKFCVHFLPCHICAKMPFPEKQCRECGQANHCKRNVCNSCGAALNVGRPHGTTHDHGFSVSRSGGRPHGTTREAGSDVSSGRPRGTTREAGCNVSSGRARGTTHEAGCNVSSGRPHGTTRGAGCKTHNL